MRGGVCVYGGERGAGEGRTALRADWLARVVSASEKKGYAVSDERRADRKQQHVEHRDHDEYKAETVHRTSSCAEDSEGVCSVAVESDGSDGSDASDGVSSLGVESTAGTTKLLFGVRKIPPWRPTAKRNTAIDATGSSEQSVTTIAPTMIPARMSGVRSRLK
jgi:hypothetical protein